MKEILTKDRKKHLDNCDDNHIIAFQSVYTDKEWNYICDKKPVIKSLFLNKDRSVS